METTRRHYVSDLVKEVGSITGVAAEVVNLTTGADCDFHKLGRIIKSDGAMTMRFLALANSAALSRGRGHRRPDRRACPRFQSPGFVGGRGHPGRRPGRPRGR